MKQYVLFLSIFFFSVSLKAQQGQLALNVYGGYTFKEKVNFDNSYAYVEDAFQYGAGFEYYLDRTKSLELRYLRMDTHLPLYGHVGVNPLVENLNEGKDKGSVNYILIGGNNYFGDTHKKAVPFGGIGLGVGVVDLKEGKSVTKFAWDARLGVRIKTESAVSVKLQAYIQSIISTFGNDYYIYPGGAVVAVTDYATIFQFGLGAAISFNFKRK